MNDSRAPIVRVRALRKEYGGLRPLRLQSFELKVGQRAAIVGLDAASAEVCVNLLTGASLADEGTVEIFGRATSDITDPDEWLAVLDRFGVLSVRAALIEPFTIAQNLAMAFTLSVEPMADEVLGRVRTLAGEAGLLPDDLSMPYAAAPPRARARCHLGRALALAPQLLLLEHANALVPSEEAEAFGRDIAQAAAARSIGVLALTADERFAGVVANDVFGLEPASGKLVPRSGWRRWLGGR